MHFLLLLHLGLQYAFLFQNLLIFLFLSSFFLTEPLKLIEHVLVLLFGLLYPLSLELIGVLLAVDLVLGLGARCYQSLLALHHRDIGGLDVLVYLFYALMHEELVRTEAADGASFAGLASFGVLNGPRVIPCTPHARFIVGEATKSAEDHLVGALENVAARGAFLDTFVLISAYRSVSEEDRVLIVKLVGMTSHRELTALFVQ